MLKDMETFYLAQIASGRTLHDIATDDDVPVGEIADHLNSAMGKLETATLMEAVAKAMRLGLIPESAKN